MPVLPGKYATRLPMMDPATHLNRSWLYGVAAPIDEDSSPQNPHNRPTASAPSSSSQAGPPKLTSGAHGASQMPMAQLVASPHALVGHALEPQQRVIQICVGAEHGVLLTDAAIAFSWGDNRYGQLGRVACLIEEDGRPYPVLDLLGEEVVQVAAGKHHCLALSASGVVWSWGRNKAGQLGVGDYKDRVAPEQVRHAPEDARAQGHALGARHNERITLISAGHNSCVACGLNSSIWQWGEINSQYLSQVNNPTSARTAANADSHEPREHTGKLHRPLCVFRRDSYRTRMRKNKTCLSETARLMTANEDPNHLKELVESVRQLKDMIHARRLELSRMEKEKKKIAEEQSKKAHEVDDMGETLAMIEQEMSAADNDIFLLNKNLESCDHQQAHHREQLQLISEQAVELNAREDKLSLELIDAKKAAEIKDLREKLQEVKEYIQANQNSRMNILDRRAQADKEKQRLSRLLDERTRKKIEFQQRHAVVKDLSEESNHARNTSDALLSFLAEQFREFSYHFDNKLPETEFVSVMQDFECDHVFLQKLSYKLKVFTDAAARQGGTSVGTRVEGIRTLLQELLDVRESWNVVQLNRWVKDDIDLSCFFDKAAKVPEQGGLLALGADLSSHLDSGGGLWSLADTAQASLPWSSH